MLPVPTLTYCRVVLLLPSELHSNTAFIKEELAGFMPSRHGTKCLAVSA